MIVALEVVAVGVEYLSRAFNMCLIPISFDFGSIGKCNNSKAVFLTIYEISNVVNSVMIHILSLPVLFSLAPHAIINVTIWVFHSACTALDIVSPLAIVDVSIGVTVPSEALLSIFDETLEALPILEEIVAINESIILPNAKVNIVCIVYVYTRSFSFVAGIKASVINATV